MLVYFPNFPDRPIPAIKIGALTIPNQAVELAEKLSSSFLQEGGSDG